MRNGPIFFDNCCHLKRSPCSSLFFKVITGSYDTTIKLFDLAAGKCMSTLTHHKKSVRALVANPRELSFISAGADNMKKWLVFMLI